MYMYISKFIARISIRKKNGSLSLKRKLRKHDLDALFSSKNSQLKIRLGSPKDSIDQMKKAYGGAQTAITSLPEELAVNLITACKMPT